MIDPTGYNAPARIPMLEGLSQRFQFPGGMMIAEAIAPRVNVPGAHFEIPNFLTGANDVRVELPDSEWVPGKTPPTISTVRSSSTHKIKRYAIQAILDIEKLERAEESARAGGGTWDPMAEEARALSQNRFVQDEIRLAGLVQTTGAYPSGHYENIASSGDRWDAMTGDVYDIDPRDRIRALKETVKNKIGAKPNIGWCNEDTFTHLSRNTFLRQSMAFVSGSMLKGAELSKEQVAAALGLQELLVGQFSAYASGASSLTNVWGKHFGMFYRPPVAGANSISFAYTFVNGLASDNLTMQKILDPMTQTWYLRHSWAHSPLIVTAAAGAIVTNVIS